MADAPPGAPDTVSSYSDPLYDRMEGWVNKLGRRWWAIVLVALLSAGAVIVVKQRASITPEAASSQAYLGARGDREALAAVAEDAEITPEYRARAALAAASLALESDDTEAAERLLDTARQHATAAGKQEILVAVAISRGAVDETMGAFEDAQAHYEGVLTPANRSQFPTQYNIATLGAARVAIARADASADPELAAELRTDAFELLDYLVGAIPGDSNQTVHLARTVRFLRAELLRQHPALFAEEYPGGVDDAIAAPSAQPTAEAGAGNEAPDASAEESPSAEE